MNRRHDILAAALACAGILGGAACGGSTGPNDGGASSSSGGGNSSGLAFGSSSGGGASSSGSHSTSAGTSGSGSSSGSHATGGATSSNSGTAGSTGASSASSSSGSGSSSGASSSSSSGSSSGAGSSSGGGSSSGNACGTLPVDCTTYYCPPNAKCLGGGCSCPDDTLAVQCDGGTCGSNCVAPGWWCAPFAPGGCGALNFGVGCGTDAGSYFCPFNSSCVGGGCTCNSGYAAQTCAGVACGSCTYPDWWCAP